MSSKVAGGRFYWVKNRCEEFSIKVKGIVLIFCWVSISEAQLKDFVNLYSSLGWNCLACISDFLNPFIPERATSLAFAVLNELVEELRVRPCPVVFATFSGGSKACMYKVFQIIEGCSEVELNQDDSRLVMNCISGQIYDSDPVDFTRDLGVRFALNSPILKMPGSAKLLSLFGRGVASTLDASFLTRFGSQRAEFWRALHSSVGCGAPFLILCSEDDDTAPFSTICNFSQQLEDLGGSVKIMKWNSSTHIGHYKNHPIQYTTATSELLEQAVLVFSNKIQKLGETINMDDMHDEISDLICDLQSAAGDSNQSLRRVALGPNDHFFLPSSVDHQNSKVNAQERRERSPNRSNPCMSAHSILGQALFDVCVPKNIEGWDIKFSGSLNGQPLASVRNRSPFKAIKHRSRL